MLRQTPLVTIIVATLEAAHTLRRCLESVLSQTYSRTEIIVMDGASTDGTPSILGEFGQALAHWESVPDRGVYHAWNKALDLATGEWICFLGADDYFPEADRLERLVAAGMSSAGIEFVVGRVAIVERDGRVLRVVGERWDWERMKNWQVVAHSGALHRRSLFERHGRFSESFRIAGDYDFLLRLGPTIQTAFIDEVLVCMDKGGQSRTLVYRALAENRVIQQSHSEIGRWRAQRNLVIASAKAIVRRVLSLA